MAVFSTGLLLANEAGATVKRRAMTSERAGWLTLENQKAGDGTWMSGSRAPAGTMEGYTSATSVNVGETFSVFVSTVSPTYSAKVIRMGFYLGLGARLI